MSDYYLDMDGKTAGPFTIGEVAELYQSNALQESSLYARPGAMEWLPLRTIMPLICAADPVRPRKPPVTPMPRPSARPGDAVCVSCGAVGRPVSVTQGSFLIEVALWLFFLLPGLIYSIWRLTSKRSVCRVCRTGGHMIPVASPRGREMVAMEATWSWRFGLQCGEALRAVGRKIRSPKRVALEELK